MPTPEKLKEKDKEKARADQAIKLAYYAARKFIARPIGDDREKKIAQSAVRSATNAMRKRFGRGADDMMMELSRAAYRGERP